MSATPDMNVPLSGGLADSLIQINQLSYKLPPQISIASKCTHVINYSQQASYTTGLVVFDCQTGSQFIDPQASYLRFVVNPNDSTHCFGSGSACNLITRVVVATSSGKELSRVEDFNLLAKITDVYNNSVDWRTTLGISQGYPQGQIEASKYADAIPSTGRLFIIPFQTLMPCMSPHGAKLVPPNIMSGLRIEITLADPNDAFCSVDQKAPATLTGYTVNSVELHMKAYELADAFQRKIQEMSVNGLNYLYKEHFHNIVSPGANSNINFDIKKACSKALTARILTRDSAILSAVGRDRMASAPFNYIKYQAHIGSDYFPNAPMQLPGQPTIDNINETYYYTMYAQDKLEKWNPGGVSPKTYLGRTLDGTLNDVYSNGIIAFNFNKSNVSDMSGYTVSNSRAVLIDLQQSDTVVNARIDVFLTFLRLAKVYQSNCVVLD